MQPVPVKTDVEIVSEWLAEKTDKNPMAREMVNDLFMDFCNWYTARTKRYISKLRMVRALDSLGYRKIRSTGGRWYLGIEIKSGWTDSNRYLRSPHNPKPPDPANGQG